MDRPRAARAGVLTIDPTLGSLLPRCHFPPAGSAVVCGVSGGADSSALLALAVAAGCRATAIHVDHGLRAGSAAEADAVALTAQRLGAEFEARRIEVEPGPNLEARARAARHAALPPGTLLGHTADDQAETVLLNLLRGAGLDGIGGIAPDARHPILALRRHETEAVCRHLDVAVVEDPTNDDRSRRRNRVRHEVLPLLCEVSERDVVPLLCRLAGHAREATEVLDGDAAAIDPTDSRALVAAPPALARRAIRAWLRSTSAEQHPPDAPSVDRVLGVARGEVTATEIVGGWRVARSGGRLRLEPPTHPATDCE